NEISPVFFSAFPDQHLDSLENPAYAAGFKNGEGRLLLLPSVSELYKGLPRSDYSISPQLTFFTPMPGSRLVVGGGASAFGVRSQYLNDFSYFNDQYRFHEVLKLNALNVSITAAYSFGDHGKTSVGIGVDRLSGDGNYSNDFTYKTDKLFDGRSENSNA